MRGTNRIVVIVTFGCTLAACAQTSWATIGNMKSYKQAHPEKGAVSCKTCHQDAMGKATNLNGYGKALQQLTVPVNPKQLTAEDIKAADAADPDKDGATTLQELDAGTDPSDAASVPPGTVTPPPKSQAPKTAASAPTGAAAGTSTQAAPAEAQPGSGASTGAKGSEQ